MEKWVIDVGFISNEDSLQEMLAAVLGFPDYYGMNWNAFWDCIRDDDQSSLPDTLIFKRFSLLQKNVPQGAEILRQCLEQLRTERPEISVTYSEE